MSPAAAARRIPVSAGVAVAVGAALTTVAALTAAPTAAAQPDEPGCATTAQNEKYCDEAVQPDGSWLRCHYAAPSQIVIRGAEIDVPVGGPECQRVTVHSLPAGSPPHHMG